MLLLMVKDIVDDCVYGFNVGVDDYLIKLFEFVVFRNVCFL